jgi:hypothetical protein
VALAMLARIARDCLQFAQPRIAFDQLDLFVDNRPLLVTVRQFVMAARRRALATRDSLVTLDSLAHPAAAALSA